MASASPHHDGLGSGLRLAAGDNVVNFIPVRMDGYFVENERTYFAGSPSPKHDRCLGVTAERRCNPSRQPRPTPGRCSRQ
jgi:Xaa-Pro aminopeptidase/Xaa-Pro dipeptidase